MRHAVQRRRFAVLSLLLAATVPVSAVEPPAEVAQLSAVALRPLDLEGVDLQPGGIAAGTKDFAVTDTAGNRVVVAGGNGTVRLSFGSIGSGPSDLLRPSDVGIDGEGSYYVRDYGNGRIQIFTSSGRPKARFAVDDFFGFAVGPSGTVYLGRPQGGSLVTAYRASGEVARRFGSLKKAAELYPRGYRGRGAEDDLLLNRVRLSTDREGNVLAAFAFAPVVQKYDANGRLLWETRLSGAAVEQLVSLFAADESGRGKKFLRMVLDGRAANLVQASVTASADGSRIYVLLANHRVVVELDSKGKQLRTLRLDFESTGTTPSPMEIAALGGELVLIDMFGQQLWKGAPPP